MRHNRKGFTLLELMIAIALMLIVMLMLRTMFVSAQEMYVTASRRVDVYSQARAALDIIEQDLMRIRSHGEDANDVLALRSLTPPALENVSEIRTSRIYSDMQDWSRPNPNETLKIREFLQFAGTATWYDVESAKYRTGDAVVVYYLRRRADAGRGIGEGAYLVRRVLPIRSMAEIARIGRSQMGGSGSGRREEFVDIKPHEEELANFVYNVRVYVDDQAAFQLGVMRNGFNLNTMPEALEGAPNSRWTWVRTAIAGLSTPVTPAPGVPIVSLPMPQPQDRIEFAGIWKTNTAPDRDFVSSRWNFPAVIMFEMTMVDRGFERDPRQPLAGTGTYRTFTRAVQMPAAGPMFRLDDRDLQLLGR